MKIPQKLQPGDQIRVIAPSTSIMLLTEEGIKNAIKTIEDLGLKVTFGKNVHESDIVQSSSIASRIEDLHEAFRDTNVKGILTVIGGFNCNELLPYIDYDLLRNNPKVLCGFSDITALANAITEKCQFVTYSGPHFSSFQMEGMQEYQTRFFQKCLMNDTTFHLEPSTKWSDDSWYLDQKNRHYYPTEWKVYSEGVAEGKLIGGNLCTLNLLQGTTYFPDCLDCILFVEDDELTFPEMFARDLASLLQAVGPIKGLMIGRFKMKSKVSGEHLRFILDKHPQLKDVPVIYDMDFGHTQPFFTLPIGGTVRINTEHLQVELLEF